MCVCVKGIQSLFDMIMIIMQRPVIITSSGNTDASLSTHFFSCTHTQTYILDSQSRLNSALSLHKYTVTMHVESPEKYKTLLTPPRAFMLFPLPNTIHACGIFRRHNFLVRFLPPSLHPSSLPLLHGHALCLWAESQVYLQCVLACGVSDLKQQKTNVDIKKFLS